LLDDAVRLDHLEQMDHQLRLDRIDEAYNLA
jgi:hypothetical protein